MANALVRMRSLRILNIRNLPQQYHGSQFPAECDCRSLITLLTNILALRGSLYHLNQLNAIALGAPIFGDGGVITDLRSPDGQRDLLQFRVYQLEKRYDPKFGASTAFDLVSKGIANAAFEKSPYAKLFTSFWLV